MLHYVHQQVANSVCCLVLSFFAENICLLQEVKLKQLSDQRSAESGDELGIR